MPDPFVIFCDRDKSAQLQKELPGATLKVRYKLSDSNVSYLADRQDPRFGWQGASQNPEYLDQTPTFDLDGAVGSNPGLDNTIDVHRRARFILRRIWNRVPRGWGVVVKISEANLRRATMELWTRRKFFVGSVVGGALAGAGRLFGSGPEEGTIYRAPTAAAGTRPVMISSANGVHARGKGMEVLKAGGDTLEAAV